MPLRILYIPRGPLLDWNDPTLTNLVLEELESLARQQRAIFIKIDPEVIIEKGSLDTLEHHASGPGKFTLDTFTQRGWRFSKDQVQFRNTVFLNLNGSEEDLLGRMKQKSRYNLRLAIKKGVKVRQGNFQDHSMLYRLYKETSIRDGFIIREESYYRKIWKLFEEEGLSKIFIAEVEGNPIAGLIVFHYLEKAWFLYGMSSQSHRDFMPNYLLQWEAMKFARSIGCKTYDLWGAPDEFEESDPLWGVFRFKEGLGGEIVRTCGAWDYTTHPVMYQAYTSILPKMLDILRFRRKKQILQER